MPVSLVVLMFVTAPIAQSPSGLAPGETASPRPNRRILAPEYPSPQSPGAEPPARRIQPDDSRLCDACFVDPQHGWAVGDHGVILHTDDGGRRWSPQASGVNCTLNSVSFVDARNGWAAGGMAYPYLHDSTGLVLTTRDGGLNWLREPVLLPALRKVRFFDERHGWAIGCPSAMFPGGVFITRDGGRSWQPACSGGTPRILTGDFYDSRRAALGGSMGLVATIGEGDFSRNPLAEFVLPDIHAIQVVPPRYGWLVGDGGWVALTGNRGSSWLPPLSPLPPGAAMFDFSTLAVRGGKCWIAGSPGSRVFFTPDAGKTWSSYSTGATVPLTAITFVDDRYGWAVGQLGLVLATSDGGRTWQRQRSGGDRAAVMAVAGAAEDLPLELLARLCQDQGHLGVAHVLGRIDVQSSPRGDALLADRLHQAMLLLGGSAGEIAWGFPVRHPDLLLPKQAVMASWDRLHNGHGADALLGHVVRQIRTWRPSVILVPAPRDCDGLGQIVEQTVLAAVRLAGDPAFLAEQFTAAGCQPWKVARVFRVAGASPLCPPGEKPAAAASGKIALAADDWSEELGRTWADAALPAQALLRDDYQPSPAVVGVELVGGEPSETATAAVAARRPRVGESMTRFDLMAGVVSTGGSTRRPMRENDRGFDGLLGGLAQSRQVEAVFERLQRDPAAVLARLGKGDALPSGIDASAAAVLTIRIALELRRSGRWDLADKALALLIERYPFDSLARCALAWRLQYLAVRKGPGAPTNGPVAPISVSERDSPIFGERKLGQSPTYFSTGSQEKPRPERALSLAREIEVNQPDLFASPAIRYPLTAVYRQLGKEAQAQRFYALDYRGVDRDAWWTCSQGEMWLLSRKGSLPKPLVACIATAQRPHLDGRLDEALWQKCRPIVLCSPLGDDRTWPATVKIAHDEQYLYLAIECRQAPGARYEAVGEKRRRDADLSQHDRVDIFLDPDRDYTTYYRLTIDHRGWAAEAACGDRSWHPMWFIAAQSAEGAWTAEAAIPLAEFKATIVPGKTIWALGVQRTAPGVGFQSWTTPAGPAVAPEGFGWLEFE